MLYECPNTLAVYFNRFQINTFFQCNRSKISITSGLKKKLKRCFGINLIGSNRQIRPAVNYYWSPYRYLKLRYCLQLKLLIKSRLLYIRTENKTGILTNSFQFYGIDFFTAIKNK